MLPSRCRAPSARRSSSSAASSSCRPSRCTGRRVSRRLSAPTRCRRPTAQWAFLPLASCPSALPGRRSVRLPYLRAVGGPQRDDAAAERAALVLRPERARFFPRRDGDEHDAVVFDGARLSGARASCSSGRALPQRLPVAASSAYVQPDEIAEDQRVALRAADARESTSAQDRWPGTSNECSRCGASSA